jgi:hypothetical protein
MGQITMQRIALKRTLSGTIGLLASLLLVGQITGQPATSLAATRTGAKPAPIPTKPLPLSDFEKKELQDLLSIGKWEEANALTSRLMLKLGGQLRRGYLITADVRKVACPDLAAIDSAWVSSSQGQFGFSVQAKLWQKMKGKGYNDAIKFEQQISWDEDQVVYEPILAPIGHLPLRPFEKKGVPNAWGGAWIQSITQQLITCKVIEAPPEPKPSPSATPSGKPGAKPTGKPTIRPTTKPTNTPRKPVTKSSL